MLMWFLTERSRRRAPPCLCNPHLPLLWALCGTAADILKPHLWVWSLVSAVLLFLPCTDRGAIRTQRHNRRRSRAWFSPRASAGPTAIKQNQSFCKWDEWDTAALICPSVDSPNVFSSPTSKQQAPVSSHRHLVPPAFGRVLIDRKLPAALCFVFLFFFSP